MGFRFRILGSGSTGNATLVEAGDVRILIDAGLGPRSLSERLQSGGVDPSSLAVVLLSHEHNDHARGAVPFSRKWGVPLAGTRGTYAAAGIGAETLPGYEVLEPGATRDFGSLSVRGVSVPHDAAAPLAFVVSSNGHHLGHATDLGHINPSLCAALRFCDTLLIESNYDPAMLRDGPYPWSLKERILGPRGHLSNGDVGRYLGEDLAESCRSVVLAHLSQKNNHPELARMTAEAALKRRGRSEVQVVISAPDGCDWVAVGPERSQSEPEAQLRLW